MEVPRFFKRLKESEVPKNSPKETETINEGRRTFITGMTAAAIVGAQPFRELTEEIFSSEELESKLRSYEEVLRREYNLSLDFSVLKNDEMWSRELSLAERVEFAEAIVEALLLYPKEYVAQSKLAHIHGVKWFTDKTSSSPLRVPGGFFIPEQPDRVTVNMEHPLFFIAISTLGWRNKKVVQTVFHHEFFHQCDEYALDEQYNAEWLKENGGSGDVDESSVQKFLGFRNKGFASAYGATAPEEDRAEIAGLLMSDTARMLRIAKSDPVLSKKLEKIQEIFFKKSGGLMNDEYWNVLRLGKGKQVEAYLNMRRSALRLKND